MKNLFRYINFIRNAIIVLFGINSIVRYKSSPGMIFLLGGMSVFLLINDYLRYYRFYKDEKIYAISTVASVLVSIAALYFDRGFIAYYFFAVIDDAFALSPRWKKALISFHACTFTVLILYSEFGDYAGRIKEIFTLDAILEHGFDLLFSGFIYFTCLIAYYSYREVNKERYETKRLNKELTESNKQLKEYAEKVEELTISKERNRVAQELHDSLGHSLTALIMHLDFIEKVMESDKERARELVIKTQTLARDSMNVLRKAVFTLKEDKHVQDLSDSINELINNITSVEGIYIAYKSNGNVESMPPDLKNIVYRTIQEGITNGLKHGGASKFDIDINVDDKGIRLVVENNGSSCREPVKGNGLLGIEGRVNVLNGSIRYLNDEDKGFGFDISIPSEGVAL